MPSPKRLKPILLLSLTGLIVTIGVSQVRSHSTDQPHGYPFAVTAAESESGEITRQLEQEIAFYQARIRQTPTDGLNRATLAGVYLKMARATGDTNWYLLAEQAATQSLTNLPFENAGAELVLAKVAEAQHDFPEAIRLAEQILASQPTHEDAQSILVTSNLAMGKLDRASQVANDLVDQLPSLQTLTLRALVHGAQGKDAAAIDDFQQALNLEEPGEQGSSARTRTLFGRFHAQRGNLEEARDLYHAALEILPRSSFALIQMAKLETQLGNYRAAERCYARVFTSPASPDVFDHVAAQGLADIKRLQGKQTEAEQYWNRAEVSFRQHQDVDTFGHRRELARLLLTRGRSADLPEALALMEAEVQIRRDAETLDILAWALTWSNRLDEAQITIQEALASGTRDAGILYRAGQIEELLGNGDRAEQYFRQARAANPAFDERAQILLGLAE